MFRLVGNNGARSLTNAYWKNFASTQYDLCIVGGGPGGYVAAIKAGQLGLKTVCVEKRGALGGTCLNVGCIPSKALLNISHKYEDANKHFKDLGIVIEGGAKIDFGTMMKKKEEIVKGLTGGIEYLFKKNKVDYVKGWGTFKDKNTIVAKTLDGKEETISAKNIMVATGSEVIKLPFLPLDEEVFVSSTGALSLKKIPEHLVVIGAGVIGTELGSVYKRLGSKVTVIEFGERVCPFLDTEVSKQFQKSLEKQGLTFKLGTKVTGGKRTGNSAEIVMESVKGGNQETLKADVVLVCTGRRPNTDNLGAQDLGLKMDKIGRIEINGHFQTNIPNIYAIGDVVTGPMLAHKAEEEGIAAVEIIAGKGGHVNYDAIPNVIYTHPEVASVGKSEEELKAAGIEYGKGNFPFMANSRAKANVDADGFIKVLTDKKTDRILGVHIIGPNAGEMIAEAVLGVEYGASAEDLARTCHAHPTLSEALKEACMAAYDKPIHF